MSEYKGSLVQRLTAREELFALRVFEGQSTSDAYKAAYIWSGLTQKQIQQKGDLLFRKPHIEHRIDQHRQNAAAVAGITKSLILREIVDQAFVDPGRIMYTKTYCCRHCHGFDHNYQWTDAREFAQAFANYEFALSEYEKKKSEGKIISELPPVEPNDLGGYEFKKNLPPDPHCPNCDGEGHDTRNFVRPTSELSPVERRAIAGISNTKYGVKVELQPRTPLLKMIAEHLGLFDRPAQGRATDDPAAQPTTPENMSEMTTEELAQLKGLLMKSLMSGDNSAPVDVESRVVPPSKSNVQS